MTDIERLSLELIQSIYRSPRDVNAIEVKRIWREYTALLPDLMRAMSFIQDELLQILTKDDSVNSITLFGQCMENLRWSLENADHN